MGDEVFEMMTAAEVAEWLRVTPDTVGKWAADGRLPGWKIGKDWRFSRTAILEKIGAYRSLRYQKHPTATNGSQSGAEPFAAVRAHLIAKKRKRSPIT